MCQDSLSEAHTQRNSAGEIVNFQYYGNQDGKKHERAESRKNGKKFNDISGTHRAVDISKQIIIFYRRRSPWNHVEAFLRGGVFKLAPGAGPKLAGDSDPRFSCGKPGCGLSKLRIPSRIVRITIENHSPSKLIWDGDKMDKGCYQCLDENYKLAAEIQRPCKEIGPRSTCRFETVVCFKLGGLQGHVDYNIHGRGTRLRFKYHNPRIGKNHFEGCYGSKCTHKHIRGDKTDVHYKFYGNRVDISGTTLKETTIYRMQQKMQKIGHEISKKTKETYKKAKAAIKKFGASIKASAKGTLNKLKNQMKRWRL
jgi:hypothetical protein